MTPPATTERYKNYRFPGEIISHGVWLYYRFPTDKLKSYGAACGADVILCRGSDSVRRAATVHGALENGWRAAEEIRTQG